MAAGLWILIHRIPGHPTLLATLLQLRKLPSKRPSVWGTPVFINPEGNDQKSAVEFAINLAIDLD